jgi:RimJ/RimL family protein N-acetyltransferase
MRDGEGEEGIGLGPVIRSPRLLMRPPNQRDAAMIAALADNPRVADSRAGAPCSHPGDPGARFAILERTGAAIVGAASYGPLAGRPLAAEVATWIGEPHWGRGFGTEATQTLIDHVFADGGVMVLWCSNRVTNARARRVIEKCGFQFREAGMARSPATRGAVPVERFVLERRNWVSLKAWGAFSEGRERRNEPRDTAA